MNSHHTLRPRWLRFPRRTARLRLTALYCSLFLLSGAGLVALTYGLFQRATTYKNPRLPKIPKAPNVANVPLLPAGLSYDKPFKAQNLSDAQQGLTQIQSELAQAPNPQGFGLSGPLGQVRSQITQIQHQLAQGQRQLANAEHQLRQIGPAQAAQRAADSHQLLINSGIALAVVAALALLVGWLIAGRMLRPIRTITSTAKRISSTSLHERLALDGPQDELKELGDTLDELFGRLDAAFDAQRHFVANASHELRTPLTAERTLLQVALDDPDTTVEVWRETAAEVLASSEEQGRLIEALLALASSEAAFPAASVDLAVAVESVLLGLQPEVERLGLTVDTEVSPAVLSGDALLIERLVANLLTNAIRHNTPSGRVMVTADEEDGRAVLLVTNSGPSIPPNEIERLFEPFQRLDPLRAHHKDGHGLGLSIVRAIATAHGATVTAVPASGGGLKVRVAFPPVRRTTDLLDVGMASF